MPRRRSGKRSPGLRFALILWAVVLAVAMAETVRYAPPVTATAAIAGGAYLLGRRQALARMIPARKVATGPYPADRQVPADAALVADVASGLTGLGWTSAAATQAARAALGAVRADSALTADTATVLRLALASADRSQAVRP